MSKFPYEIHPQAYLGPMQDEAVEKLILSIKRKGYDSQTPIALVNDKIVDGRHRQAACLRLKEIASNDFPADWEPPVVDLGSISDKEIAQYVLESAGLMMARTISPMQRKIYVVENFTSVSPTQMCEMVGLDPKLAGNKERMQRLTSCYKRSKRSKKSPTPWEQFREGKLSATKMLEMFGFESDNGSAILKRMRDKAVEERDQLSDEVQSIEAELSDSVSELDALRGLYVSEQERVKELERRVKKLDPQERISRSAGNESDAEDRLRDRLEFTEDELKKSQKINEQFADKVRDLERLHHTFEKVFSNVDWGARAIAPPVRAAEGQTRAHEFLALMSDAHYGEVVSPSEALGISYNCDIAKRRMEHYRDTIIRFKDLREPVYGIDKLTVAILGDMLSGNIHDELRVYNEKNMTEQTAEMTRILKDFAFDFASEFPEVEFIFIPGNHPRLFHKPEFKKKWDNWEIGVGNALQLAIEEGPLENVQITVPHSMVYIHEIFGQRIAMLHGDSIKSNSFAGIPFYGMRNRREGLQSLLSSQGIERADMLVMGHFHQHLYWSAECDILINGAIKGGDEYSIGSYLSAPEPMQVLLEFHPEQGLVAQEHISLGHVT